MRRLAWDIIPGNLSLEDVFGLETGHLNIPSINIFVQKEP